MQCVPADKADRAAAAAARLHAAGLVFQFPERHFLGATIQEELTFGWPARAGDEGHRLAMSYRTQKAKTPWSIALKRADFASC